jgi:hypothetical protein
MPALFCDRSNKKAAWQRQNLEMFKLVHSVMIRARLLMSSELDFRRSASSFRSLIPLVEVI